MNAILTCVLDCVSVGKKYQTVLFERIGQNYGDRWSLIEQWSDDLCNQTILAHIKWFSALTVQNCIGLCTTQNSHTERYRISNLLHVCSVPSPLLSPIPNIGSHTQMYYQTISTAHIETACRAIAVFRIIHKHNWSTTIRYIWDFSVVYMSLRLTSRPFMWPIITYHLHIQWIRHWTTFTRYGSAYSF